ncbi:hypothetical protein C8J57DRAFT_1475302 [Mycena rebaudengoi]|nr:hypothetical protein C8J57DRAFT_1475302 [Mycena rebaudengoi]
MHREPLQDPRILPLVRSGRLPPSSQTIEHIESLIKDIKQDISRDQDMVQRLEEEISSLQNGAWTLNRNVWALQHNQRVLTSLFAPIRKLPPEILGLILGLAVPANCFDGRKSVSHAMRVSEVCAHWRAVALSTPRIWAVFMVDLGKSAKRPAVVSAIERHLELAGDALLDLNLWAEKGVVVGPEILPMFFRRTSRWYSARFKLETIGYDTRDILSAAVEDMPFLETLHIQEHDNSGTNIDIEFFKSCPRLKKLFFIDLPQPLSAVDIPWNQLTTIHFAPNTTENVYTVLNLCTQLISLSVRLPAFHRRTKRQPNLKIFALRTLRILVSHGRSNPFQFVSTIFTDVTLPALTCLSITSNMRRSWWTDNGIRPNQGIWPQRAVVAMLTRSACKLTTLRIEAIPLEAKEALALLALAPTAIEVSLHECRPVDEEELSDGDIYGVGAQLSTNLFLTPELLHALTVPKGSEASVTPLIPRLRHFELKVNQGLNMAAYIAMVRSRWPGSTGPRLLGGGVDCLNSVSLTVMDEDGGFGYFDLKPLLALEKEGMKVRVGGAELFYNDGTSVKREFLRESESASEGWNDSEGSSEG